MNGEQFAHEMTDWRLLMIKNTRRSMAPIGFCGVALMLLACGKDSSNSSHSSSATRQDEEIREGRIFKSQLLPLNTIVSGSVTGTAEWIVTKSKMRITLSVTNSPEDLEHFQAVHAGSRCPTESADLNSDGIIDIAELEKVSGQMLFPLDSDLSSAEKGDFLSSRANAYGNYVYWAEADLSRMRSIASNPTPENRVIVVYGINSGYSLPGSVEARDGNKHRYIPISCGVVKEAPVQNLH